MSYITNIGEGLRCGWPARAVISAAGRAGATGLACRPVLRWAVLDEPVPTGTHAGTAGQP